MNILRRTTIKFAIIAAVMLLAGVFYRCSREQTEKPRNEEEQVLVLSPEEETAQTGTSDSDTHDFPEPLTSEEHLSREETPESVVIEEPSCFVHICGAVKTPGISAGGRPEFFKSCPAGC